MRFSLGQMIGVITWLSLLIVIYSQHSVIEWGHKDIVDLVKENRLLIQRIEQKELDLRFEYGAYKNLYEAYDKLYKEFKDANRTDQRENTN